MPPGLLAPRRIGGPVPWIIGIMACLMALAGAAALGLTRASQGASAGVAQRVVVQVVDADPVRRDVTARRALATLRAASGVASATLVPEGQLASELRPWLGDAAALPLPAVIDVVVRPGGALPRWNQTYASIANRPCSDRSAHFSARWAGWRSRLS